jgi:hypothetical protein
MAQKKKTADIIDNFENINLKFIPFESQGDFEPAISTINAQFRTKELKDCNDVINMARRGGKLIAAVVEGEPSSGKTALAHKLVESSLHHPKTKHIILKMQYGSFDDPFFILKLIIDKLAITTGDLDQSKVESCINEALDLTFKGIKFEKSGENDIHEATRLMSLWFGYINALVKIGGCDCVVIHLDEVEDRWGMTAMTRPQIERDLKYLRDLIGYIQEGKTHQKFPVALFLYMTAASFQHIGGINNALKTRLERVIPLNPFTDKEAVEFVQFRLKNARISNDVDENYPFTQEGLIFLTKKSVDEKGLFSWRILIKNCHDILYSVNQLGGGSIDKKRITEWLAGKVTPPKTPVGKPKKFSAILDDVEFKSKMGRDKAEGLIAEGFLEDKESQLHFALKNIGEILHDCSDRYVVDSKLKKVFFTIPNEKARIPISIKMVGDPKISSDIFTLYVSNSDKKNKKQSEDDAFLLLPDSPEMALRFALYDPMLISSGEITTAKDQISDQVMELNDKIIHFFEKHRKQHYISSLFGSKLRSDDEFDNFIMDIYYVSKNDTKKANVEFLSLSEFFDGATITAPSWYNQILSANYYIAEKLAQEVFYFNSEGKPIESAVKLLKKIGITDGYKLFQFDERKSSLIKEIEKERKEIAASLKECRDQIGEQLSDKFEQRVTQFIQSLDRIKNSINTFKSTDNTIVNFVELYYHEHRMKSVLFTSTDYINQLKEISHIYHERISTIKTAFSVLEKTQFKNSRLEIELRDLSADTEKIFEQVNMLEYAEKIRPSFDEVISKYTQFSTRAKILESEIKSFKIDELERAVKNKLLDLNNKAFSDDWKIIQESTDIEKVDQKFKILRGLYTDLEIKAENHIRLITNKNSDGKILVQKCELYLNNKQLESIQKIIKMMEEKIDTANKSYKKGNFSEVFIINIDTEFGQLGPKFKSLFKPNKEYTLELLQKEFNIDERKANEFVKFLVENKVLVATYKVV